MRSARTAVDDDVYSATRLSTSAEASRDCRDESTPPSVTRLGTRGRNLSSFSASARASSPGAEMATSAQRASASENSANVASQSKTRVNACVSISSFFAAFAFASVSAAAADSASDGPESSSSSSAPPSSFAFRELELQFELQFWAKLELELQFDLQFCAYKSQ